MKKIFIWNTQEQYQNKINDYILHNQNSQDTLFEQIPLEVSFENIFPFLKEKNAWALLHRNEHGLLHCTKEWVDLTNKCIDNNIPVLSFDFGYFCHYKSFMVDFYQKDCVSSIYSDWNNIPIDLDWNSTPNYIQEYRNDLIKKVEFYKNLPPPLDLDNIVVIWGQWTTDLIKHYFYEENGKLEMDSWMKKLIPIIKDHGFNPVIKMSPVKSLKYYEELQKELPVFVGLKKHLAELPNALYLKDVNAQLIAHAKYHIVNCSSVSNELFLNNCKVIAMGRSWFDNLGVFYEPKNWNEIFNYKQPSEDNKNKWVNWWMDRQCLMSDIPNQIIKLRQKI